MLFRKLSEAEKENVQEYTLMSFTGFDKVKDDNEVEVEGHDDFEENVIEDPIEAEKKQLLSDAIKEAERIKEDAKQEGYDLGYQAGYDEGKILGEENAKKEFEQQYETMMKQLETEVVNAIHQVEKIKEQFLDEHMEALKDISVAVAEKIIQISLKSSEEIIKRMVIASTEKLKKKEWAKIYIGTSKESIQVQGDPNFMKELSNLSDNVKIIMMNEQEYGTCIVELPDGIMDISVATQLENIKDILNNAKLLRSSEE